MKTLNLSSKLFSAILIVLTVSSCEKSPEEGGPVKKDKVSGFVQKGPYLIGTSLDLSELNADLGQTGKVFRTDIGNNQGAFEISNIELSSSYVEITANGFYFNEVRGENSSAQLTLSAVSDLRDKSSLNVNVLSHLEKDRLFNLVNSGMSFGDAKKQAQEEVLRIFTIEKDDMVESEMLNIAEEGDDNAILLAVSVILQGYMDVADMSELIGKLNADLKEDGILDDASVGVSLMNNARLTDLDDVRSNLEDRYEGLEIKATIPVFEKYVQQFIDSSGHEFNLFPEYSEFCNYGRNILYLENDTFQVDEGLGLAADLPEGTSLMVKLSGGIWFMSVSSITNWIYSGYNSITRSQEFTATAPGGSSELHIIIPWENVDSNNTDDHKILIEYFENGSSSPTRSKEIIMAFDNDPGSGSEYESTYPEQGTYGPNLLAMDGDTILVDKDVKYSLAVRFPQWDEDSVTFYMEFDEGEMFTINPAELGDWNIQQETNSLFGIAEGKDYLEDMSILFNKTGEGKLYGENGSGTIRVK